MTRIVLFLFVLLAALPVSAKTSYGGMVGVGEYVGLNPPEHQGVFPCWGLYASIDVRGKVNLIPALSVEAAPENGHWGLFATFTADVPVHKYVGLDATAMLLHDQKGGDWGGAEFLAGAGPGVTVYLGDWSVGANAIFLRSLNRSSWVFFPGVGISHSIP